MDYFSIVIYHFRIGLVLTGHEKKWLETEPLKGGLETKMDWFSRTWTSHELPFTHK